jgi:hypothetical protein
LVVRKIPNNYSEVEIETRFSQFGELRSIQKLFGDSTQDATDLSISYSVEYFNIQDSRLAASELSSTIGQFWGPGVVISFAPLDSRKQALCRQLLATLSRWRAELAAVASYGQPQLVMAQHNYPQYNDRNMMMMMAQQQQQQQQQQQYFSQFGMPPTPQPMVYGATPMDQYGMPLHLVEGQQYYPSHSGPMYPPEVAYNTSWQQQVVPPGQLLSPQLVGLAPNGQVPMPSASKVVSVNSVSLPTSAPVPKSPRMREQHHLQGRVPFQDSRPVHHNGGHAFNRKLKTQATTTDAEFLLDLKKLSLEDTDQPADRRTTLMVIIIIYGYTFRIYSK